MYKIGDSVWVINYKQENEWITCPSCNGSKFVTVIFGDGTHVQVNCGLCDLGGWQGSTGLIMGKQYLVADPKLEVITGINVGKKDYSGVSYVTYYFDSIGRGEDRVAASYNEAVKKGGRLEQKLTQNDEQELTARKKNVNKNYAWNANFHLKAAEEHERKAKYHREKAKIMELKVRKPKDGS